MARPKSTAPRQVGAPTKTFTMITLLRKHGPMTCAELAKLLDVQSAWVGETARLIRRQGRYGLYVVDRDERTSGKRAHVLAIDEINYQAYMNLSEKRLANRKPPRPSVKEPKVDYNRSFPRPVTKYHTAWQPSSPYYQDIDQT